jgi:hypothetical protein
MSRFGLPAIKSSPGAMKARISSGSPYPEGGMKDLGLSADVPSLTDLCVVDEARR